MGRQDGAHRPVLLLGAYGRGNVGDDVFLYSAATLFKDREVYSNSTDDSLLPPDVQGRIHTISTQSTKGILKKLKVYLRIKAVVYWGGDLWVELLYGTRWPRQMLYKMALLNVLLRLSGKRIYYIGCGIGDLHGFSLWLARLSARLSHKIVTREQRTAGVLGLKNIQTLPDLAINSPFNKARLHTLHPAQPFVITISILQDIPNPHTNFPRLLAHIATFLNDLPKGAFKIVLLSMHIDATEPYDDLRASQQLKDLVTAHPVELLTSRKLSVITKQLRNSNLIIGGRLHANILGVLNATPTIGIAYRPKVRSFFVDNRLDEYCLDLDDLEKLPHLFGKIHAGYGPVAKRFYEASRQNLGKQDAYRKLISRI